MAMEKLRRATPAMHCQVEIIIKKIIIILLHLNVALSWVKVFAITQISPLFCFQVPSQVCPTSSVSGGKIEGVVSTRRFPAAASPPPHPSAHLCTAWAASNAASWTRASTCCKNNLTGTHINGFRKKIQTSSGFLFLFFWEVAPKNASDNYCVQIGDSYVNGYRNDHAAAAETNGSGPPRL